MTETDKRRVVMGKPQNRTALHIADDEAPTVTYLGGMRDGGFNATWPLVRLDLFPSGLRMQSSTRFLRGLVPTWEARFDEIQEVQAVGKIKWFSTGIRFRAVRTDDWVVFWTIHRPRVLESIEAMGVSVNATAKRLYFLNPGR